MAKSARDGIEVDSGVEELGGRVVAELLERAGDADPTGIATVAVGHGVGIPRRTAVRLGRERVGASRCTPTAIRGIMTAAAEPVGEQLACQRVEGDPPPVAVLGRLLDVLPLLNQVVVGEPESLPRRKLPRRAGLSRGALAPSRSDATVGSTLDRPVLEGYMIGSG